MWLFFLWPLFVAFLTDSYEEGFDDGYETAKKKRKKK